jgi:hypothetical protein
MKRIIGCCAALAMAASPATAADPYQFNIERTVGAAQTFSAAKGEKLYAEKSIGQPGMFLTERFVDDDYDVVVEPSDPLTVFTYSRTEQPFFGRAKQVPMKAYCPDKVGSSIFESSSVGKVRRTKCFIDSDNDQRFDEWITGYADVRNSIVDDTPDGVTRVFPVASSMTPIAYTTRPVMPDQGKEGVIELRYDGIKGGRGLITVIARFADSDAAVFSQQASFDLPKGSPVAVGIAHPVFNSDSFRQGPSDAIGKSAEPAVIPTMSLTVTAADAKSIAGSIVSPFPDWLWFNIACMGPAAASVGGAATTCDVITTRLGPGIFTKSRAR